MIIETLEPIKDENGQIIYVSSTGQKLKPLSGLGLGYIEITADTNPDDIDGCEQWITYHQKLVQRYGRTNANQRFTQAWESQSFWAIDYNFCKYNCDFSNYFKSQGLDIGHLLSNVVCTTNEVVENTTEAVQTISQGVTTTSSVVSKAVPVLLIGLVAAVGYIGYQVATGKKSYNIAGYKIG